MGSRLFGVSADNEPEPFEWGHGYLLQEYGWGRRLMCSTDGDRIAFLERLMSRYPGPFQLKFILEDNQGVPEMPTGRYHSPLDLTATQISYFFHEFSEFLSTDGRHHLMISSATGGAVVYDQHDYFFVYGGIDELLQEFQAEGYTERDYRLGTHGHKVHSDVEPLRRLLRYWPWTWSQLEATDTSRHRVGLLRYAWLKVRAWWFDRTRKFPD